LRDSGRLQSSIVSQANSQYVDIGTNVIYGPPHQFGATIKAKNAPFLVFKVRGKTIKTKQVEIPARPFMPIILGTIQLPKPWENSALNAVKNHMGFA
jgi:phage gpG-like protein